MGEVFEAINDALARRVAIKMLHAQLSGQPQIVARFMNEARFVNIVRHPSLVDVYELGQLEDGALYIVMELLEGETLSARLRARRALDVAATVRFGRQMAGALATAHGRGVVHRDLKPDNVMLVADPEVEGGERVKVLDFGIARLIGSGNGAPSRLTRTGFLLGTPQYMAPEQCRGSSDVDGKADVYALGLILYEAISGGPPFSGGSEWELFAMQLNDAVPPLPANATPALAALVDRMLAKEPAQRPTMADVAARLTELRAPSGGGLPAWQQRATILAPTTPPPLAGLATAQRSHGARFVVGGLLLAIAALLVAELRTTRPPPPAVLAPAAPPLAPSTPAAAVTPPVTTSRERPPVRWTLTSLPSGASIDRADSGEHVGETPWHHEQPPGGADWPLALTLAGHRRRVVTLAGDHDEHRQIRLDRAHPTATTPQGDDDDVQTVH